MKTLEVSSIYDKSADIILYNGSCLDLLKAMPDESAKLIVTSPPYNIGKKYEKKLKIETYLKQQEEVIIECYRILQSSGSICWQIGNYVNNGSIIPLDIILFPIFSKLKLKLRNRILWHFEHGLHCKNRFSGRYETIIWFTKSDNYTFNLDPVRVPQKYPGKKYFKGPKAGQYSSNPKGKNPGDLWIIPNVKHNHVEKTIHQCQFPIELVERLILSMTNKGDLVFDPFIGVGSTAIAAILHNRRAAGADIIPEYIEIGIKRIKLAMSGQLKTRKMNTPIYTPTPNTKLTRMPKEFDLIERS